MKQAQTENEKKIPLTDEELQLATGGGCLDKEKTKYCSLYTTRQACSDAPSQYGCQWYSKDDVCVSPK